MRAISISRASIRRACSSIRAPHPNQRFGREPRDLRVGALVEQQVRLEAFLHSGEAGLPQAGRFGPGMAAVAREKSLQSRGSPVRGMLTGPQSDKLGP
jgi:hypothetical protein